ncbi:MAG: NTP transferase domain-containing protein [Armatimonadetes bacterium]|nr:NTP transferase domain-containing protein [Armatimonadota bacterium]
MADPIPAIMLAGGRASPELARAGHSDYRALAAIHGQSMGSYVLRALRATPGIGEVVVVGPQACAILDADRFVASDAGIVANTLAAFAACDFPVALVVTADIPLVTPAAFTDYLGAAITSQAAFCYSAIPRAVYERQLPRMKRTWVHLADGVYTGGNVVLIRQDALAAARRVLTLAVESRKQPWKLISLLGWRAIWRWYRCRLTLREIEMRAARLLDAPAAIVVAQHAALGADVDKPEDLAAVRAILSPL